MPRKEEKRSQVKNAMVKQMQSPRIIESVLGVTDYDKLLDLSESLFVGVAKGDVPIERSKELRQILNLNRLLVNDQIRVSKQRSPAIDADHFGSSVSRGPFKLVVGGDDSA